MHFIQSFVRLTAITGVLPLLFVSQPAIVAFRTGLKAPAFNRKDGWIAATCPAGYAPSLGVSRKNWDAILKSEYNCRKE